MGLVTWFIFSWMMGFFLCTVSSVILDFSTSTVSMTRLNVRVRTLLRLFWRPSDRYLNDLLIE